MKLDFLQYNQHKCSVIGWSGTSRRENDPPDDAARLQTLKRFACVAERSSLNWDNWVSPSLPRCRGAAGTRWLDDGVVGRGSNGEGLLGEAMKEQPAGL